MLKKPTAKKVQPGDLSYLHEKVGHAISTALFADEPATIAHVFEYLSRGIDNEEKSPGSPLLADADIRQSIDEIRKLITPSEEDGRAPGAAERGTFQIRAERMTKDERRELAGSMWALFSHVGYFGR